MAQLIVRDLEDDLKARLRARAKARGHSMEEEVRQILRGALLRPAPPVADGLGVRVAARFRGIGLGPDEMLPELRGAALQRAAFGGDAPSRRRRPLRRR